ncbi:MAG: TonB-dependent receptor [Bacteroidetes bacterium]|nr:TonB-dependent receptor [Bacteroidota bacterium]
MKLKFNSRYVVTFRHWSRKPFAVMSSLQKVIKIGVMCVTYSMLTQPGKTYAQADSTQVINNLKEVVVSAQRAPVTYSNVARVVHVIPRSEIANAPVLSLNELLDYSPGVDIRQRGTHGIQADVSIQGGSFDQSLILLNGINISDPQTGHLSMNLPIDIESVSRIEVLTGSASRVFGANAFTGAINIITNPVGKNYIRASASAGDFGLYKAGASVQYNLKNYYSHLSYSKSASDGYTHNTDFKSQSLFYQGGVKQNSYFINFQAGYNDKDYGANSFYSSRYADQYEENQTWFGGINAAFGKTAVIKPTVYWRRNYDHYILIRNNPAAYQNFHFTDVLGSNLNAELKWKAGTTNIGLEYRKEQIYSTRLGEKTNDSLKVKGEENIYYIRSASRNNFSIFAEHSINLNKFSVSGGVMINHYSSLDKGFVVYPGIDAAYRFTPWSKVYATYNKSLRLPTFTDLYYTGPQNLSNPDLEPEEAHQIETGLKYNIQGLYGNISYFYRKGINIIDLIEQTGNMWQSQNITRLNTQGLEITSFVNVRELTGTNIFINKLSVTYNYTEIDKESGSYVSAYVLDNLKHKFSVNLNHVIYKNISANWYLNWQDRNGNYGKYDPATKTTTETPYKPFWLLDGRINWKPGILNVFAEVSNIFAREYYDFGNIVQPGRWFKIGLSIELGI